MRHEALSAAKYALNSESIVSFQLAIGKFVEETTIENRNQYTDQLNECLHLAISKKLDMDFITALVEAGANPEYGLAVLANSEYNAPTIAMYFLERVRKPISADCGKTVDRLFAIALRDAECLDAGKSHFPDRDHSNELNLNYLTALVRAGTNIENQLQFVLIRAANYRPGQLRKVVLMLLNQLDLSNQTHMAIFHRQFASHANHVFSEINKTYGRRLDAQNWQNYLPVFLEKIDRQRMSREHLKYYTDAAILASLPFELDRAANIAAENNIDVANARFVLANPSRTLSATSLLLYCYPPYGDNYGETYKRQIQHLAEWGVDLSAPVFGYNQSPLILMLDSYKGILVEMPNIANKLAILLVYGATPNKIEIDRLKSWKSNIVDSLLRLFVDDKTVLLAAFDARTALGKVIMAASNSHDPCRPDKGNAKKIADHLVKNNWATQKEIDDAFLAGKNAQHLAAQAAPVSGAAKPGDDSSDESDTETNTDAVALKGPGLFSGFETTPESEATLLDGYTEAMRRLNSATP